jgi:hypothetical protein
MIAFDYTAPGELFPSSSRNRVSQRRAAPSRRFDSAAEAIRFAIEELEPELLDGTYLEVNDDVYDGVGIRNLYARDIYPLSRRISFPPPASESA